ncbi:MAG: AbrB/MazE/SpoVT family DNA-binding domain-containing protein [Euryarchaeota archaeon]|nr:AbrB/MazE/SpoVT family DNA-binding domain-containing protein [Euryarchaeota archaeon]
MLKLHSRMGPRGQTVIPKPVRDELGLRPGDELDVHVSGGQIVIEPAKRREAVEFFLRLGPKKRTLKRIDWEKELYQRYR